MERINKNDLLIRVKAINEILRGNNSPYGVGLTGGSRVTLYRAKFDATGTVNDSAGSSHLKGGTKQEVYTYLCGMIEGLRLYTEGGFYNG